MAPASQLGLVVLATSSVAFAARGGHAKGHTHKPRVSKYTAAAAPFGYNNGTATVGPTGTGYLNSTKTTTNVQTQTVYNTVTLPGGSGSGASDVPVGGAAVSSSTCGGTVSVTVTDTVTVTAGSDTSAATASSSSAPAPVAPAPIDSSADAYPATETTFTARSVAPTPSSAAKVGASKSKAAPAPVKSSQAAAPSAYPAPASSSSAAAPAPASSSASAPSSYPSSSSGSTSGTIGTKRGCLYKGSDSAGCDAMISSGAVKWSTNWCPDNSAAPKGAQYIPQMWGTRSEDTSGWNDAVNKAISAGASAVLGFNEPDRPDQANLDAKTQAAPAWNKYIAPLKSKGVTLVSPSTTSQVGSDGKIQGITWLQDFASAGASWDATGIHFYADCSQPDLSLESGQVKYLKDFVTAAAQFNKPVWVTEFGCYDGTPTSQIEALMKIAVPYLEGEKSVAHYAPYMAQYLASGSSLNAAGQAYVSA